MTQSIKQWTARLLVGLMVVAGLAQPVQAQITPTYTFSPNTVIQSSQVNANFNLLLNAVNRNGGTMLATLNTRTLLPTLTNTYDIGSSALTYRDFYLGRNATIGGTLAVTGAATFGSITVSSVTCTGCIGPTQIAATAVTAASYGGANSIATFTVDADGRLTAAAGVTPQIPIATGVTGLGTGVATALAVNVGSSGAFTTWGSSPTFNALTVTTLNTYTFNQSVAIGGSPVFAGLSVTTNGGFRIADSDESHYLFIAPGSNLSTDRTLTVSTGDANRALIISGDATVSQDYGVGAAPIFTGTNFTGIPWAGVSKSGSSLADLATRSASDLSSGTLADARLEATIDVVTAINAPAATFTTMNTFTFNQSVASGATPTFTGTNFTGIPPAGVTGTAAILGANTFTAAQTIQGDNIARLNLYDTGSALGEFYVWSTRTGAANRLEIGEASGGALITIGETGTFAFTAGGTFGAAVQAPSVELGHASDTTLTRASAGVIAVEGNTVAMLGTAQTFTTQQTISVATEAPIKLNNTTSAGSNGGAVLWLQHNGTTHAQIGGQGSIVGTTSKNLMYVSEVTGTHVWIAGGSVTTRMSLDGSGNWLAGGTAQWGGGSAITSSDSVALLAAANAFTAAQTITATGVNLTLTGTGDQELLVRSTAGAGGSSTLRLLAPANRFSIVEFDDSGTPQGRIVYTHTADSMGLYAGGAVNLLLTGASTAAFSGTVAANGFGTHTFSAGGTGTNRILLANPTSGTGNYANIGIESGTNTGNGVFASSQGYTPTTGLAANGMSVYSQNAGGLDLFAFSGNVRISGNNTLGLTLSATAVTTPLALTLSGTAANIALGSNFLSGDGGDEGLSVDASGNGLFSHTLSIAGNILRAGAIVESNGTPVCTSGCTFDAGRDYAFSVSAMSSGVDAVITFGNTWTNPPICVVGNADTSVSTDTYTVIGTTTTTVTINSAASSPAKATVICRGY